MTSTATPSQRRARPEPYPAATMLRARELREAGLKGAPTHSCAHLLNALDELGWTLAPKLKPIPPETFTDDEPEGSGPMGF